MSITLAQTASSDVPNPRTLSVRLFGLFAFRGDRGWEPGPPRHRGGQLLQMLVALPGATVTLNAFADAFAPDVPRDRLRHRLHITASGARAYLRRLKGYDGVRTIGCGYALSEDIVVESDYKAFVSLYRMGTIESFARAIPLYTGELLAGEDEMWVQPIRARAAGMYVEMLERLAIDALEAGRVAEALDHATSLAMIDRSHEATTCLVMRCHAAMGRRMAVISEYESLKRFLLDHLGAEPSPETQNLYYTLTS